VTQEATIQTESSDETSLVFVGQWQRLVSTTNWEKGQIIHAWREALVLEAAPAQSYSDEAWSRRVGNVSGQHVGRLRRVYERFGQVRETYPGLYWSHFQAALDWNDAEMWLEGAVRSGWSISEMRGQRWQTLGAAAPGNEGDPSDPLPAEFDEDAGFGEPLAGVASTTEFVVDDADHLDEDERATDDASDEAADGSRDEAQEDEQSPPWVTAEVRPFEGLVDLPPDLHDAFESMKLAILRHKLSQWAEVSADAVIASLAALQQLALSTS